MKTLVIIDMQNDFCTGALKNDEAVKIIPFIKEQIKLAMENGYKIIFTRDTHQDNYLETTEGTHLPFVHCINGTEGWNVVSELEELVEDYDKVQYVNKNHFGYDGWHSLIDNGDDVVMVGTCTDICVVSNALAIKTIEGVEVTILAEGCAGLTPEKHEHALDVMDSCQCKVMVVGGIDQL